MIVGNYYLKKLAWQMQLCVLLFLVSCQNMLLYTNVDTKETKNVRTLRWHQIYYHILILDCNMSSYNIISQPLTEILSRKGLYCSFCGSLVRWKYSTTKKFITFQPSWKWKCVHSNKQWMLFLPVSIFSFRLSTTC